MSKPSEQRKDKRLIFVFVPILFFLIIQELLLRLIFPLPEILNFNRIDYSKTSITSAMKDLKYLSNASFTWASDPDGYESKCTLNLYGFRDRDFYVKGWGDKPRVLFIGDSFVEGFMAKDDETIPGVFERIARESGPGLEAMNFGVSGVGVPSYFKLMSDAIALFRPDHLILVLYANDFPSDPFSLREPVEPLFSSGWLPRSYYVIKNMLADKTVPRSWTADPFPFIAPVPDPSNPWSKAKNAEYYEGFIDKKIAAAMKKGRFNPYSAHEYYYFNENLRKPIEITAQLKSLKVFAERFSTKLHVVYLPSRSQVSDAYLRYQKDFNINKEPTSLMGNEFQRHALSLRMSTRWLQIPFLDLTPLFREKEAKGERLFWNYDEHMKSAGYEFTARSIYGWWQKDQEDVE